MAGKTGYEAALSNLYHRVKTACPKLFESEAAFNSFIDQTYGQETRFYHGVRHLLNITAQSSADKEQVKEDDSNYEKWAKEFYPKWSEKAYDKLFTYFDGVYKQSISGEEKDFLKQVNLLAAVNHDTEYHVDGQVTEYGKQILADYITIENGMPKAIKAVGAGFPSREEDRVAHMVVELFGLEAGKDLSPFNGQNEFLSALVAAKRLEKAGADLETIIGVVASIEATWPFKEHKDYVTLRDRLDALYEREPELVAKYADEVSRHRRVDMLNGAATLLANQDVIGFLGGLKPGATPTFDSLSHSMSDCQFLVTEEGPKALHHSTAPGDYNTYDILAPTFKRVRLNEHLLKPGKNNLFHCVTLRGDGSNVDAPNGVHYPAMGEVAALNSTVRALEGREPGNGDIVNNIFKARVGALALVHAVALALGKPDTKLKDIVEGMQHDRNCPWLNKRPDMEAHVQLAMNVLDNRPTGSEMVDVRSSPIAVSLLNGVSLDGINKLYVAAEKHFGKTAGEGKDAGKAFINEAAAIIGKNNVQSILGAMVKARQTAKDYTTGEFIGKISKDIPQELS